MGRDGSEGREKVSKLDYAPRLVAEFARIPTIPDLRLNSCEFSYYGFETSSSYFELRP